MNKKIHNLEKNNNKLFIKHKTRKNTAEYNSMMETIHVLSSKKNVDRLYESIQQMKKK